MLVPPLNSLRFANRILRLLATASNMTTIVEPEAKSPYGDADNLDEKSGQELPAFKQAFKRFKAKKIVPVVWNEVIDVSDWPNRVSQVNLVDPKMDEAAATRLGLTPFTHWSSFGFPGHPGLLVIKGALSQPGQLSWAEECLRRYPQKPHATNIDPFLPSDRPEDYVIFDHDKSLKKLRWVTLGYHHNWETKEYDENSRSPIPSAMQDLCAILARSVDCNDFVVEAAIVHYYHHNSTLSGHVDRSERNLEAPLLAISLGQSAIFLIGGPTLNEEPSAIILRSGDVMIMQGEARSAYHAIPRILKDTKFPISSGNARVVNYLNENRLNMNIRQVNFF